MNRHLLLLFFLASFGDTPQAESVRKVDYSGTPEMKDLAERARQIGDVMYLRILALTLFGRKNGDSSTYNYTVVRSSKDTAWKLQKAWRTGTDGHVIEDYPIR